MNMKFVIVLWGGGSRGVGAREKRGQEAGEERMGGGSLEGAGSGRSHNNF